MRKMSLFFLCLALCFVVCPSTHAADKATASNSASKYGGTMRVVLSMAPTTPIGWMAEARGLSFATVNYCLETLLREDNKGKIMPGLATSYEINTDPENSSITFHLRKGVKFHDGSDFNAQAVKWNYDMLKSVRGRMKDWKSFDVIDEYTIRVNLTPWQNRFVRSFSGTPTAILSPTAFKQKGKDWMRWHMVGTGPWVQKEFIKDVSIKFVRNDNYWEEGKPYLDGIELLYVRDPFSRGALIKKGEVDALSISYADFSMAAEIEKMGYQILDQPTQTTFLVPDSKNQDSPWSNPLVRMAAEYAIDKETMAKKLGYGYVTPLTQICSSGNLAFDPNLKARKYDPAKAKELLEKAGYPDGFDTSIIHPSPPLADKDTVAMVQSYFKAVGIRAKIDMVDPGKMSQYKTAITWNNAVLWAVLQEKANFNSTINTFWKGGGAYFQSLKKPAGWLELCNASLTSMEMDQTLLRKVVGAAYDDAFVIPLSIASVLYAVDPKLHDTGYGSRGSNACAATQNAWWSK